MMYKIVKEKFMIPKLIAVIALCVMLLVFGKYSTQGALEGLYMCGNVLIPSLFPFMILAGFTVNSGLSDYIGKYMGFLTKGIFGVSGKCGATILLSVMGGFPVGARGVSALYESRKISVKEAEKLAYSLVCAGPGFLVVFIGTTLLDCPKIGTCIFASQVISVLILGLINKLIFRKDTNFNSVKEIYSKKNSVSDALISSVKDCTYSMLEMCGIVIVFSAFISIIEKLLENFPMSYKYLVTVLEVTSASDILCDDRNIPFLAFAVGFGGLSVHFQVFQALKNIPVKKWLFMIFRVIQGIITAAFTYIFIKIFNISLPVYSSIENMDFTLSSSVIGSIFLLLTGVCFIYNLKNYKS